MYLFLGVTAFLVPNHHAGLPVKSSQTADNGVIIGVVPITVKFFELREYQIQIVKSVRSLRMPSDQGTLPRSQFGVNFFRQVLALHVETGNLFGNINSRIVLHKTKLLNLRLELGNRLFKFKEADFHASILAAGSVSIAH